MRRRLVLGLLMPFLAGSQTPPQGAKRLIEIVISTGQADPPKVPYSPRPLTESAGETQRAPAPVSPAYIRAFGSPAQNSRTPGSPKPGQFHVRWLAPLPSPASSVLFSGSRILAQRGGGWSLFSLNGEKVGEGIAAGAPITLDPSSGVFYSLGAGSNVEAIGLEKGELRYRIPLGYDESHIWPLFERTGNFVVAAAVEQPMLSPKTRPPEESLFQVVEMGSPVKLSPYKLLLSISSQQDLIFKEANMLPVASDGVLWAVLPDLLIRTSPAQTIDGAWNGSFRAASASADEAGWLYLAVSPGETASRARELWVITPEGRLAARTAIPAAYAESKAPPAVGYDHRVYLASGSGVAAFSPGGQLLWDEPAGGPVAGISVTPDGRVAAAAGANIVVYDSSGKVAHLANLPAAATTAPVVTAEGEILVGLGPAVACLASR